jgi:hypothetical protein
MRAARRQVRERLFSSTFWRTHRDSAANAFLKVLTIVFALTSLRFGDRNSSSESITWLPTL